MDFAEVPDMSQLISKATFDKKAKEAPCGVLLFLLFIGDFGAQESRYSHRFCFCAVRSPCRMFGRARSPSRAKSAA